MDEITYDIKSIIGCVRREAGGWRRMLTVVSWNGAPAKLDIRSWDEDMQHMTRGLTFSKEELPELKRLIAKAEL